MRKLINVRHAILLLLFFSSCIGAASYEKKLTLNYGLLAIDDMNGMVLYCLDGGYRIGIVSATVFAVGLNDDFIIVKQHPCTSESNSSDSINKQITNYFIIPIKNKISENIEKNIFGPLTFEKFEKKKKELKISNIDFTIVFKDLE